MGPDPLRRAIERSCIFIPLVVMALSLHGCNDVSKTPAPPPGPSPLTVLTASPLPNGAVSQPYNVTLAASGGTPGYTWSLASGSPPLPSGLTLSATGIVSGTPTTTTPVGGPVNLIIQVLDSGSAAQGSQQTATKTLSMTVDPAPIPLQIVTNSLPQGSINTAYFAALIGNGGATPYTWGLLNGSPPLPPGLTLDTANGLIQGTPTQTANPTLIITLHDARLVVVQKSLTLTISAVPLLITTTSLPQGGALQPYSFQLVASGGTGPGTYTWTLTDPGNFPLPIGLVLDSSGLLHGVPTAGASGTYSLKFTVTDQTLPSPESKSTSLTLSVN